MRIRTAFVFCVAVFAIAFSTAPLYAQNIEIQAPDLNVSIPGLDFRNEPVVVREGYATIPFLSSYIASIYRYVIGISVVAAGIMILYGGFRYIVGGTVGDVARGKSLIRDAIIGLVLILGIYTILSVVNQDLLSPSGITVKVIEPSYVDFITSVQLATDVETGGEPFTYGAPKNVVQSALPSNNGGEVADIQTSVFDGCPLSLEEPDQSFLPLRKNPLVQEFFREVQPLITGKSFEERVVQAGDAAIKCKIQLGSCASTVGALYALSGAIEPSCLTEGACIATTISTGTRKKNIEGIKSLPGTILKQLLNLRCVKTPSAECPNTSCVTDSTTALSQARAIVAGVEDYPDSFVRELRPGDYFTQYTGNTSCGNAHSIIFMGWADAERNVAQVIEGPGVGKDPVARTRCLSSKCGNWLPITQIARPISVTQ